MAISKPLLIIIGLVAIGGGLAGVFLARKTIDSSDADAKLTVWAEDNVAPVKSVSCPSRIKEKKDVAFDCVVTFVVGRTATIHVEEEDGKGDVHYWWSPPIVSGEKLATRLEAAAVGAWKGAIADCGKGIEDVPPEGLRCTLTKDDKHEHVVLLIKDGQVTTREEP